MTQRVAKFRKIGAVDESGEIEPQIKRNMKASDAIDQDPSQLLPNGLNPSWMLS